MDDFPAPGALPDPLPARSRGNGLPGKHFVPLLAVDARVTGDVLTTLAAASIAAYARPRTATTDEVYSDAGRRADARSLLAVRLPEVLPPPSDTDDSNDTEVMDAAFAEIVAAWDAPAKAPTPPAPAASPAPMTASPSTRSAQSKRVVDPDDDHYVPPPTPPLPRLAAVTRWALIGVIAGILALVLPLMIGLNAPVWTCAAAVVAIVGGGAVIVARMGNDPHDGDDGAVV